MAYSVRLAREAYKDLGDLPVAVRPRVAEALRLLRETPRPAGCKKSVNLDAWRLRVGDYRIVYLINDTAEAITVAKIKPRASAYR
jgi:mRNA interferase RelE/StbE